MKKEIIAKGDFVICDFCNADGDANDGEKDLVMGGMVLHSSAVCGKCCANNEYLLPSGEINKEKLFDVPVSDIHVFDQERSFGANVRAWRLYHYGTENAEISFTSFDNDADFWDGFPSDSQKGKVD